MVRTCPSSQLPPASPSLTPSGGGEAAYKTMCFIVFHRVTKFLDHCPDTTQRSQSWQRGATVREVRNKSQGRVPTGGRQHTNGGLLWWSVWLKVLGEAENVRLNCVQIQHCSWNISVQLQISGFSGNVGPTLTFPVIFGCVFRVIKCMSKVDPISVDLTRSWKMKCSFLLLFFSTCATNQYHTDN